MRNTLLVLPIVVAAVTHAQTIQDFDVPDAGAPFESAQYGAEPGPEAKDDMLLLVNPVRVREEQRNSVAFELTDPGCHAEINARFEFLIAHGAHGMGFALLNTEHFGTDGPASDVDWEAPNLPGSIGVGFDTFNPPTSAWFDEHGNFYGRPQREFSLHYDGVELAKIVSPVEFRGWDPHEFRMKINFVPGGAIISVWIDDTPLWRNKFFAGLRAYECRPAFGARTGDTKTTVHIDDVHVEYGHPGGCNAISPNPTVVGVFKTELLFGGRRKMNKIVELPAPDNTTARIVGILTLEPGPGGWDKWDKSAAIYAWRGEGEEGERFEIVRYITPYRREWTWRVDLTDFDPLLRGDVKMGLFADSWQAKADIPEEQKAFNVSFDIEYYPASGGAGIEHVIAIHNLWNTTYTFGNSLEEIDAAFLPIVVEVPEGATGASVRTTVTGHSGFGEFTRNDRTLIIDDRTYGNTLWKEDVYLNPVRPQSGTWKFDRAGWSPGDVVRPWIVDVPAEALADGELTIRYRPSVFQGEIGDASHWIESQIVFYGPPRVPPRVGPSHTPESD